MVYKYRNEFVFFDNVEGEDFFYAPTLNVLIFGTEDLMAKIKKYLLDKSVFPEFDNLLKIAYEERPEIYNLEEVKSRYFHVALGLTENCTLSCVYCHADAGKDVMMPEEILIASAEYAKKEVKEKNLKGINVSFAVGGEPTYNLELLKKAINVYRAAADECNVRVIFSMTTNGFYPEATAQFISENINNILFSLDGMADIQNLHRPTKNGRASFNQVLRSMDVVFNNKGELSLRATISNQNLYKMKELMDFIRARYEGKITLVMEPLVPLGRGIECDAKGDIKAPEKMDFARAVWDAYCYGQKKDIVIKSSGMNVYRLVTGFCGAMYIPSFTVTTGGVVTTCERDMKGENYGYGKYDERLKTFRINQEAIAVNKERVKIPEKCDACICRYHCAGDCPDVRAIGYDRCESNRYLLKQYLKKNYCEERM